MLVPGDVQRRTTFGVNAQLGVIVNMAPMAAVALKGEERRVPPKARAQEVDRYVGARIRERRLMLGITQQQMAELTNVTNSQAHKYEQGINRIAGGRLFAIAQALRVGVGYFFLGMESEPRFKSTPQQRMMLELARYFVKMPSRRHQEAVCGLARTLANLELREGEDHHQRATAAVLTEGRR
jgi:transcriptional regulator with XRE-family HTH domain